MEPRLSIITLGVDDLDRAREFYLQLDLPLKKREEGIAFFLTRGTQLALYPREKLAEDARVSPEGSGFPGFTIAHNVRSKEEVRAVLESGRAVVEGDHSLQRRFDEDVVVDVAVSPLWSEDRSRRWPLRAVSGAGRG